jgi:hypothetical protein
MIADQSQPHLEDNESHLEGEVLRLAVDDTDAPEHHGRTTSAEELVDEDPGRLLPGGRARKGLWMTESKARAVEDVPTAM